MVPKGSLSSEESHERVERGAVEKAELLIPAPEALLTSLPELSPHWCMTDLNCRPEHTLETVGKGLLTACSRMNCSMGSTQQRSMFQNRDLRTPSVILAFCGFLCASGIHCFRVCLPTRAQSFVKSSNSVHRQSVPPLLVSFRSVL